MSTHYGNESSGKVNGDSGTTPNLNEVPTLQEALDAFSRVSTEIELLLKKKEQIRSQIPLAVEAVLKALAVGEVLEKANELYWSDEILATPVKKAFKKILNNRFEPKEYHIEFPCRHCGEPAFRFFSSWSGYRDSFRYSKHTPCVKCKEDEEGKSREARAKEREAYEEEINRLRSMPYREYLQTEHWQNLRLRMLKRSGFRCQLCNDQTILHVHHRTYENLGEEFYSDLIVLCKGCHERHHDVLPTTE